MLIRFNTCIYIYIMINMLRHDRSVTYIIGTYRRSPILHIQDDHVFIAANHINYSGRFVHTYIG